MLYIRLCPKKLHYRCFKKWNVFLYACKTLAHYLSFIKILKGFNLNNPELHSGS